MQAATIVAVCEGALVDAVAGRLTGKRATRNWSALNGLPKARPDTIRTRDCRYVLQHGKITSTTAVTTTIPMQLALIGAIGGLKKFACITTRRFGVTDWTATHRPGSVLAF